MLDRGALGLANVLEHRFAPAINVDPRTVADTVAGAGDVNYVAAATRGGDAVVRLLVPDAVIPMKIVSDLVSAPISAGEFFVASIPRMRFKAKNRRPQSGPLRGTYTSRARF